ncbi:MAG: hypothetical protein IPG38_14985 [Chitinophagaceae bacterium]|nr:hypothetical protein [Chitinophagaceae bacterium]
MEKKPARYNCSRLGQLISIMPDAAYGNNVVYFVADSVFNIGTNYFTYNLFFAFDISSGTQLWKRRGTTDKIEKSHREK